jgi:hypothetical protein
MPVIEISRFRDSFVIHFQTDGNSINAYTLATALVALADAARAANAELNPGYDIEIVVDALTSGSFRAKVTAIYKKARNLFSNQIVQGIVLGVIGNYIYERTLARDSSTRIAIHTDEVIVERGDEKVIVPRNVYEATQRVKTHPEFSNAIATMVRSVAEDSSISAIGIVPDVDSPEPAIQIQKPDLAEIGGEQLTSAEEREIEEECTLDIVRAIMRPGRRKWEFIWRGVSISAPILDQAFYQRFAAHDVTIAPGDSLRVRLAMKQKMDPDIEVFTTWEYEVREVLDHIPRVRQLPLAADSESDSE